MKRIRVAAGVIRNQQGQILVGQRTVKDRYYQKWEFPGGKLEQGETPEQALTRELHEELAINVVKSSPLITIHHDYPDRKVALFVREVSEYQGVASGAEGQAIKWIPPEQLDELDFLEANQPIIRAAQLPAYMLVTQTERFGVIATLDRIELLANQGKSFIIQVREADASLVNLEGFILDIKQRVADSNAKLILNGDIKTALSMQVDGVHLKATLLNSLDVDELRQLPKHFLFGASCHNQQEIEKANQIADYAILGSVLATKSHPDGQVLGWQGFQQLTDIARVPVYAIGGMNWQDKDFARKYGAQGVAMIMRVWES